MSKAGSKIMKGLKEAHAVAKGEPPPGTRIYAFSVLESDSDRLRLLMWLVETFNLRSLRGAKINISIEFRNTQKQAT